MSDGIINSRTRSILKRGDDPTDIDSARHCTGPDGFNEGPQEVEVRFGSIEVGGDELDDGTQEVEV